MGNFYNKYNFGSFNFKDNLSFSAQHQREEVSFQTSDLEILYNHHNKGWTFKQTEDGFIIRAPEEWLVDLTDPYKIIFSENPASNLAYYNFLKTIIDQKKFKEFTDKILRKYHFRDFHYCLLSGPSLESEIRVAGSDSRVTKLKELMIAEAENCPVWNKFLSEAHKFLGPHRKINPTKKTIQSLAPELSNFFYRLKDIYQPFNSFKNTFNNIFIPNLFKGSPKADIYLFIPWGCFRYIPSFINKKSLNKIMFWELHYDKQQTHKNKYLAKKLKNKKVQIIDNSYSGNTLSAMAKLVKKEGGKPIRLALFPKSTLALHNSEYVLFIDKIIKSQDIIKKSGPDWIKKKYKDVLTDQ